MWVTLIPNSNSCKYLEQDRKVHVIRNQEDSQKEVKNRHKWIKIMQMHITQNMSLVQQILRIKPSKRHNIYTTRKYVGAECKHVSVRPRTDSKLGLTMG